jgi:hypothetical protein
MHEAIGPEALIAEDTGFLKDGDASACVSRQYTVDAASAFSAARSADRKTSIPASSFRDRRDSTRRTMRSNAALNTSPPRQLDSVFLRVDGLPREAFDT